MNSIEIYFSVTSVTVKKYTTIKLYSNTAGISIDLWADQTEYIHINGLVQERHNFSALAMELLLSCINSSISYHQSFS